MSEASPFDAHDEAFWADYRRRIATGIAAADEYFGPQADWDEINMSDINWKPFIEAMEPAKVYETKDSGAREVRPSGYQRDTQAGKPRWDLLIPEDIPYEHQFLTRVAALLARGAEKYQDRNWEKADDEESLDRFKSSAFRHLMQWMANETDEDHAAAVVYNLLAYESTFFKMARGD